MKARTVVAMVLVLAAAGCAGELDGARGAAREPPAAATPPPGSPPIGAPPPVTPPVPAPVPPMAPPVVAPPPAATPPPAPPPVVEPPCRVSIVPENPPHLLSELLAGPNSRLRVRAQVSGPAAPAVPAWKWEVLFDNSSRIGPVVAGGPDVIEFPLSAPGSYRVRAEATPGCFTDVIATAASEASRLMSYWVRVTPPRGWDLPPQDNIGIVVGGGNLANKTISLDRGVRVRIDPHDANDIAIGSFIRVSSLASAVRFEGHNKDTNTGFSPWLLPQLSYEVLLVPDGPVAPALIRGRPTELVASLFKIDPGVSVSGEVQSGNGAGTPVTGARVLLRSGGLPSTIGTTSSTGAFQLRARPGTWTAVILPPAGSGLPEAHVDDGIDLGASPAAVRFQWRPLTTANLDVTVTDPSGRNVGQQVRVRIQADPDTLADVGVFQITGGTARRATGFLRLDASTGPDGVASFGNVPAGRYQAVAVPPADATNLAMTTAIVDAGSGQAQRIGLARPVVLTGSVQPAALSTGLQVVALDPDGSSAGEAATATIDEAGQFRLGVVPGRSYRLQIEPAQPRKLPRLFLGAVTATADTRLPEVTLAEGVTFTGTVNVESSLVPGAVIQVYCTGFPPDCVDPAAPQTDAARPVGETITDANGRFQVTLPDPRSWHL
jgi:hypothetical protein